ncbi:MAG: sigma-54-dependent Fis family transcriptional regulator [Nitrospirae bacterium]|nr:sigma-54-dependent Fis family transcriptional regulator [Nitrospirota bacterium]
MNTIMIVDDEQSIREGLGELLEEFGFKTTGVSDGRQAIDIFTKNRPSVVLLDLRMPGMGGMETLAELGKIDKAVPVIMITGHGDVEEAVTAMKQGAYDFVTKPPHIERLVATINRAVERLELERKVKSIDANPPNSLEWLLGSSAAMKTVIEQIRQVAWSDMSVLVQGDTGTGKSVVARAIHGESRRSKGPFVAVDIGAIPETLVESELFGHEKGAFTGAERKREGMFRAAQGGTLFIDELQNMSLVTQGKLLRAVDEKVVYSLGSSRPVAIDARIISATNIDVRQGGRRGRFREDLYFRLGEFVITIPPLSKRTEDIPRLAERFMDECAAELCKPMRGIDEEAEMAITGHSWPGNVRELKSVIRKAVLLSSDGTIRMNDLLLDSYNAADAQASHGPVLPLKQVSGAVVRDAETRAIRRALELSGGNKSKAAVMLQVDYKTLLTKMKEYSIQ